MAYSSLESTMVKQAISDVDTTANHPLGRIVRASDPTYGSGEFIYLKGVASNAIGLVVTYDAYTGATTLAPATANLAQPLAVSMSAATASQYGWFQVSGASVVKTNGTLAAAGAPVYLAGSGQVSSTGVAGKQVVNAVSSSATGTPSSGFAVVTVNRPFAQGAIT